MEIIALGLAVLQSAWALPWAQYAAWTGAFLALSGLSDLLGEVRALRAEIAALHAEQRQRRGKSGSFF